MNRELWEILYRQNLFTQQLLYGVLTAVGLPKDKLEEVRKIAEDYVKEVEINYGDEKRDVGNRDTDKGSGDITR